MVREVEESAESEKDPTNTGTEGGCNMFGNSQDVRWPCMRRVQQRMDDIVKSEVLTDDGISDRIPAHSNPAIIDERLVNGDGTVADQGIEGVDLEARIRDFTIGVQAEDGLNRFRHFR